MEPRGPRVLAVGDAIVDIFTPPLRPLPAGDVQRRISGVRLGPGGNATNFALQIASLGARTTFVGSVGTDVLASILIDAFRRHGVRARLTKSRSLPTGASVAVAWLQGGRALVTSPGANAALSARGVSPSLVAHADHVHRAGFWWTPRLGARGTARLLAQARRGGASTSLDVATDPDGWTRENVDDVRAVLPHVTTFLGNEAEIRAIGRGRDLPDSARNVARLGVQEVVVHRGAKGASCLRDGITLRAPAFPAARANPTGCGDVFNAGYVLSRLGGRGILDALIFANACAAAHLQDPGRPYPTRREVARILSTSRGRARL